MILVSCISLKHLRGIDYWRFKHEGSSDQQKLSSSTNSIRNSELMNNVSEITHLMEEENCHIILAALNPSAIQTVQFNKAINTRYLLKWSWFNLGRNSSHMEHKSVLYVAIGSIDKNDRSKDKGNCFSLFWSIIFWLKERFDN